MGSWCDDRGISYTRYCDDMTFSGNFDPRPVIQRVKSELKKMGLFLNDKKTIVVREGQKHSVTGIIVNERLSVPSEYKKQLRQEMYYCMKFGIQSHLDSTERGDSTEKYILTLLGRINYVLSVEPQNEQMQKYKAWLKEQQKKSC